MSDLAGVVLAAGAGTRLAPLTRLRPKALCPVGGRPLLDLAIERTAPVLAPGALAVNLHHGAEAVEAHLARTAVATHRSLEAPEALGTAGALGNLAGWIDGRDVLVTNADAWLPPSLDVAGLVETWDRSRVRLLTVETPARSDFGSRRYCGVALLPARLVAGLEPVPTGLYEVMWRHEAEADRLDLVVHRGPFVDCGTPADYLHANMVAAGGRSVVGAGATVGAGASLVRSVVWDSSEVAPGEHLVDAVRAEALTVLVR